MANIELETLQGVRVRDGRPREKGGRTRAASHSTSLNKKYDGATVSLKQQVTGSILTELYTFQFNPIFLH